MQLHTVDTSKQFEDIYLNLLSKRTIPEKFKLIESISSLVIRLSKKAIRDANPTLSKTDLDLLFIKLNYGDVLHDKLKKYFNGLSDG
jgi:hypothetical protein